MSLLDVTVEDRKPSETAAFDAANRVFFRLYQTANLFHKVGARSLSSFGATPQQSCVLGALAMPGNRERGLTVKELMGVLMVSRQNLSPVISRLEKRGWIERLRDADDERSRRMWLTDEGEIVFAQMLGPIAIFYSDALQEFTLDEQMTLYQLLNKLRDRLVEL